MDVTTKAIKKAQTSINKVARPAARRGGKATVGAGKIASELGYKGTGRKMQQHGRASISASKVKDLKSARKAIDMALKANK